MDILINAAGGLIVEVVKYTVLPIKRHICNFFNHKSKVTFLNGQLEKLKDKKEKVQHCADAATRNGCQIEQHVQRWLSNVDKKITEDAEELQRYEVEAKKRCFIPFCPDFISRYHLSKKADKEANLVVQLLTEANQFPTNEIFFDPDPQLTVATSAPQGFETFKSREVVLHNILQALKEPNIQMIGVYGMGGVGKTTLMKEVAAIAKEDNLFDEVAIATISNSQKTDIKKAQGEIGDALGLTFKQETESGRANQLRQRLNNGRKIIVILDDIWDKVDLEAAGIIFEKNQNKVDLEADGIIFEQNQKMTDVGCKLLLTSRSRDTLCIHMNVETNFELTILSPEESMALYTKIVGNKVEEPDYKPVAKDVVAKCAGLPVAISAVANALKEKDIDIWKNALQQLKRANPTSIEGMEKSVYSALKLSYEYLQNKAAQILILLCSLRPQGQDILISDLIKYNWGMDLLEDVCTVEEARRNTTALIQKLKGSSLLLRGNIDTALRIHDVVRDVCISIAAENNQMFVIEEQIRLEKLLKSRKLENCTALSLPYSDVHELPDVLNCQQLELLMIDSEDGFLRVPNTFFKETKKLKVLQVTGMEFSTLPSSFPFLTNLRTLCFHRCKFQNIAMIGELKNLEVLSFSGSDIMELPMELENLGILKILDLSGCYKLVVIPANLISSLCGLEELYMGKSFDQWDSEGNASLSELKHLCHLTALEIHITDIEILPINLFSENLERYKIFIGRKWEWYDISGRSRVLKLDKYSGVGVEMLLKKTEELYLHDVAGVLNVLSMLDGARTFPCLRDLHVQNCFDSIQYLFDSLHGVAILESLTLIGLMNLEKICYGQFEVGPFNRLKAIKVQKCRKMKNLLSCWMAMKLCQLQEIEVFDCENIVEIVHDDRGEDTSDKIESCSLQTLKIKNLPKLTKFCNERHTKGEEDIDEIVELGSLSVPLFNCKGMLCYLQNLELTKINIPRLWDNENSICSTSLTSLAVKECKNLENLISTSMARCLNQLKRLKVMQCKSMVEIIATDVEEIEDGILFPNLDSLHLHSLPKLTRFSENSVEFFSLRELSIKDCLVLKSFITNAQSMEILVRGEATRNDSEEDRSSNIQTLFDERVYLPRLERLTIDGLESLRRIWHTQLSPRSFNNINSFYLSNCDRLLNVFSISMLGRLQRLGSLVIGGCDSVKEIFDCEELNLEKSMATKFQLPTMTELTLLRSPKLKSFSHKAIECPLLRRIYVYGCNQMHLVFCSEEYISSGKPQQQEESQQSLFWVNKIGFPCLEELCFEYNENLKQIWKGQLPSQCFPHLKLLKLKSVEECSLLWNSFLSLPTLEKLEVGYSSFFPGGPEIFSLPNPQLRDLKLIRVQELRCLWDEKFEPFRPVFHKLTTLNISLCQKLKTFMPSSISFSNLVTLTIFSCHGLITLLTHPAAESLVQLTTMKISYCDNIKEIITKDGAKDGIVFTQLKYVELISLNKLEGFCLGNCSIQFPSLDELSITSCPKMTIFCQGEVVTPKLQTVKLQGERHGSFNNSDLNNSIQQMYKRQVELDFFEFPELVDVWSNNSPQTILDFKNCIELKLCNCRSSNLRYLLTPSMALSLVNLETLKVENCTMIEQVMAEDAEEIVMAKIILRKLSMLVIKSCFNLRCFCRGYDFQCPLLTTLEVAACPKMITFSKGQEKETFDEESDNYNKLGKTIFEPFFNNKVSFPKLRTITISHLKSMKMIWDDQILINSFCNLRVLKVVTCEKLLNIFSSNIVGTILVRVEELYIKDCHSLEEIFEVQGLNLKENHIIETKLRTLHLLHLPKLKQLWNKHCRGTTFTFENLWRVSIVRCWNLRNVFPISVARGLVQLHAVHISFCGIEEFLSEDKEERDEFAEFVFPELTRLQLWKVPKLRSFFPKGLHKRVECPKLRTLKTFHCGKLKMFTTKQLSNIQEEIGEGQLQMPYQQQPPFSTEKVIPTLRELSMDNNDVADQFPTRLFNGIETLCVQCYHDESTVFPFSFLQSFHNLRRLLVRCCKFKDLFPYEGDIKTLPPIWHLGMFELPELKHIWKEDLRHHPILENLKTLNVSFCGTLSNVAPSSASFQNLTVLTVRKCKGMKNILAAAACRNLVCLEKMSITECYLVTEIIADDGDEGTSEVIFGNLEHLELDCLPSLTSFCSGNYAFHFPYLEKVIVKQCPGLKFFSKGVSSTPLLERVQQTKNESGEEAENKGLWAGDLNATIQQLYIEKDGYRGLRYMDFYHYPELIDIWNRNLQEILDFKSLESLEICNFSSFKYLFNHSMALTLVQLRELTVRSCIIIEQVINAEEGFDGSVQKDGILFPLLSSVFIDLCPDLKGFYLGKETLECLSLNKITVINCPKMINFASTISKDQNEERQRYGKEEPDILTESFFTDKVVLPSLVYLKLSSMDIQKIWDDKNLTAMTSCVQHLTDLIVEGCGNLECLLQSSMLKSCAQLETLEIRNCNLLNGVVFMEELAEEERIISTPTGNHFEFSFLRELVIENCPLLETFITNSLSRDMTLANKSVLWDEKVAFPSLEKLKLQRIAAKAVWQRQYLTANSLVHLTRMSITDCEMIREIITCEPDEAREAGIVFYQLKYLELGCLPYLESFCCGEYCFGFPSLEEVTVKDCPNMKIFSGGESTTPKLPKLKLAEDDRAL